MKIKIENLFLIPYSLTLIESKCRTICKEENLKLAYYNNNKLNKFIRIHKDKIPKNANKNVVYNISCRGCDVSYVGIDRQESQYQDIGTSTLHKLKYTKPIGNHGSQIVISIINSIINFNIWENIKKLGTETSLNKYLISEKSHIYITYKSSSVLIIQLKFRDALDIRKISGIQYYPALFYCLIRQPHIISIRKYIRLNKLNRVMAYFELINRMALKLIKLA